MKFTLTIESSNAAVVGEGAAEVVADMVAYAASQVRDGFTSGYLRDGSNGPSIGYWEYTPEQEYPAIPEITAGDEDAKAHANCTAERCDFCDHVRRNCLCGDYCPYNRKGL